MGDTRQNGMENQEVKISEDVIYQELDGEMVLLDMKSGEYFGIDTIGSRIWVLLEQGKSPGQTQDILIQEYDVDPVTCSRNVQEFLLELKEAGLIEVS